MEFDEEKLIFLLRAIGLAVLGVRLSGQQLNEKNVTGKLEEIRQAEGDLYKKKLYTEAAEIIRSGNMPKTTVKGDSDKRH